MALLAFSPVGAQTTLSPLKPPNADSLLLMSDPIIAELDSILNSPDSLSILGLLDSLLLLPPEKNQLAVRVGYNSNVVGDTRTLNINKFGLSPGLSFYHRSGAFADLASYWSKEYNPRLYLTMASVGYLATPSKHWSVMAEYSHYFYNKSVSNGDSVTITNTPYTNNIYIANFLEVRKLTLRLDYSLLFGDLAAHRIYPAIGLNLVRRKWLGLDRVTFFPSAGLLYGRETLTTTVFNWTRPAEYFLLKRQGLPTEHEETNKVWGVMNYNISFPLSIALKGWSFLASYTYNFPQTLPGETLDLSHSGYITVSITRYFDL